jgi:hypothetical protein
VVVSPSDRFRSGIEMILAIPAYVFQALGDRPAINHRVTSLVILRLRKCVGFGLTFAGRSALSLQANSLYVQPGTHFL